MATAFIPHRDRHPLHGITVVLETADRLYVGRLDTADDREVVLKDLGYHEGAEGREAYLARTAAFGIRRLEAMAAIPAAAVQRLIPLHEALA